MASDGKAKGQSGQRFEPLRSAGRAPEKQPERGPSTPKVERPYAALDETKARLDHQRGTQKDFDANIRDTAHPRSGPEQEARGAPMRKDAPPMEKLTRQTRRTRRRGGAAAKFPKLRTGRGCITREPKSSLRRARKNSSSSKTGRRAASKRRRSKSSSLRLPARRSSRSSRTRTRSARAISSSSLQRSRIAGLRTKPLPPGSVT